MKVEAPLRFLRKFLPGVRADLGVGCRGFPEHLHTETMGWHPRSLTVMLYLTWGAPLTIRGRPCAVHPLSLRCVRADTPHGVLPSDGRCPVLGVRRRVLLVSFWWDREGKHLL